MHDELRDRLRAIDPMPPGVPTSPVTAPPSRDLLEHIMTSPTIDRPTPPPRTRRRLGLAATAAASLAAVAVVAVVGLGGGSDPDPVAAAPLELTLGASDALASCLPVSADLLAPMPVAFEGTVETIESETVVLTVGRWFTAGEAQRVSLLAPAGMEALIGGIDFQVGASYLITATDGVVNYCGFSAPATPDLRAMFEEAFGG